jgi:predicted CXXCH cytochrome family protein
MVLWPMALAAQQPAAATAPARAECLGCHAPIAEELKKPVVHPDACLDCHIDHQAVHGAKPPYLKTAQPELCLGCHDGRSAKLVAAHRRQPFQAAVCTGCHDPHASRAPKLIYESQHGPFGGRHCDECHGEPVNGKIEIHGGKVRALCLTCHVKIGNQVADSKSAHAAFDCTDCHTPHASDFRPHLKEPREVLCRACHEERAQFTH